jgi:hypothetical protein
MPSQIRYAAPISFIAVNVVAEACTTAATPSAEAIVHTRMPALTPNAVASAERRP